LVKLLLGVYAHLIKFWEVDVMETESARELPDPFNGIELRAIRRKKVEAKPRLDLLSPSLMQQRVMVLRIVENNDRSFSASKTFVVQLLQKLPTGLSIEFLLFRERKQIFRRVIVQLRNIRRFCVWVRATGQVL
jgi:hypothetical protein